MTPPVSPPGESIVRVERMSPGIAVVVLDRPSRKNAMSPSCIPSLVGAIAPLADDRDVRVVILTGAGNAFCAGMDLGRLDEMAPRQVGPTTAWMRELHGFSLALDGLPQPTIAAVSGPAVGGGLGMALACDVRIASPTARFGATFAKMALGPDAGVSKALPAVIGHSRALDLLLTGDLIDADEALRIGLVSSIADDALASACALAARWADVPTHAARSVKSTLRSAAATDMRTTLWEIEPQAQASLICHPDFFDNAESWLTCHGR